MTSIPPKMQKIAENCKKLHTFNRKSAETAPVFVQNKPKVKSPQIDLNALLTNIYAQMDNWLNAKNKPNQTQFKANSKPTLETVINPYIAAAYTRKPTSGGRKNKPNTNPTPGINTTPFNTKRCTRNTPAGRTKTNPNKPNDVLHIKPGMLHSKGHCSIGRFSRCRQTEPNASDALIWKGGKEMLRWASVILITLAISSANAAEPFRLTLTDVEQNIYKQTVHLTSKNITPDCPHAWSIRKQVLHGGKQDGVEVIEVDNGALRFTVIPTRGMSIQQVAMGNLRLGWDSPIKGLVHPKFINLHTRQGLGWLEGFNEWMVRCGLEYFGGPGTDEFIDNVGNRSKMDLTLHGKIGNIPASQVEITVEKQKPYRITIRGMVEETCMHGPKLELSAEVSTLPGSDTLRISDKITNRSAVEQEFGILYHANYGTPLMEKGAEFVAPAKVVTPISKYPDPDVNSYNVYRAPTEGIAEQVFCLELWADNNDRTKVMLRNAAADKAVSMDFSVKQLPFFTLWKNPVAHEDGYVTGLEPGTGFPNNRSVERLFGRVPKLAPHQARRFTIDFTLHTGKNSVKKAADQVAAIQSGRKAKISTEPLPKEKIYLKDVIKEAKNWRPSYTSWYGKPAPDFTVTDLKGNKHKLSDYRGKNVLLVFWTTWCAPCRLEMPHLMRLRNNLSEEELAILAISNEHPDIVKKVADQVGINYTVLLEKNNMPEPFGIERIFGVSGIPSAFYIEPDGKIKVATSGLTTLSEIKAIIKAEKPK
jgi:peroxiredoxin